MSHDRDFIDRLATSTIALNGRGDVVETPGGWQDFLRQNPGYFGAIASPAPAPSAPKAAPKAPEPKKTTKLSFKDQHRLKEAEGLMASLPAKIAKLEADMADPALYARDPTGFDKLTKAHAAAQAELVKAEEDWMTLEEMREALEAGR